jgi:hypothetical protein
MRALRPALALLILSASAVPAAEGPEGPAAPLHGRFTQAKTVAGLNRPLSSEGSFALLPGRGLVWRTERPLASTVLLTPKGVFVLDPKLGASRRLHAGSEAMEIMGELLSGDAAALGRTFTVRRERADKGWALFLRPHAGPLATVFTRVEARGGDFAQEALLVEADGDETRIRFQGQAPGTGPLSADEEALLGP